MSAFVKDKIIFRNQSQYRIVRPTPDGVQLENVHTGELSNEKMNSLLREYTQGILRTLPTKIERLSNVPSPENVTPNLSRMSDASRAETRQRIDYITRLADQNAFELGRKNLILAILEIARSRNEVQPPHISTIYRWRKNLQDAQNQINALFSKIEHRGGKNRTRLTADVEAMIDEKVESIFLTSKCGTAEDVHEAVFLAVQIENTKRIESEWLKPPGLRTIQRRIERIYGFDIAVARYGMKEALRRYGVIGISRRVSKILELVEIDHTPVDLMVVNDDRVVIGRPMITFVLDRFSRCVLGYHLTLGTHGTPAVFEALRHSMLPKSYLQDRYSDLNLTWECYGWMDRLLMDNGREFHANAVVDAMLSLGVITEYAEAMSPNDKPFVERFIRTFNYSFIHKLPGTTMAKLHLRIGFKAEDEACLTLQELDKMIHAWILGKYHLRPHSGLGKRAPIDVWRESAKSHPPQLKANAEDVDIEFSEVSSSVVQHYGIDLNTFKYSSPRLSHLRSMLPVKNTRVDVKWPRNDVGHIYVWDAFEKEYFKVENNDNSVYGLTLEQAKSGKKIIDDNPHYKRVRANTGDVVREIVAVAAVDKKLKTRRKAARFNNENSEKLHRSNEPEMVSEIPEAVPSNPAKIDEVDAFEIECMSFNDGAMA